MPLSSADVKHIAHLARLELPESQIESLAKDLDNILALVNKMNEWDTRNVKPLAHPNDAIQPLRADIVTEPNQRDLLLENAPQALAGLFIVPKVIETE